MCSMPALTRQQLEAKQFLVLEAQRARRLLAEAWRCLNGMKEIADAMGLDAVIPTAFDHDMAFTALFEFGIAQRCEINNTELLAA